MGSFWPRTFGNTMDMLHSEGLLDARGEHGSPQQFPSGLSTQAETHCLFRARYSSDYVLFLHSLDAYLSFTGQDVQDLTARDFQSLPDLLASIDRAAVRDELAAIAFEYVSIGGDSTTSQIVIE